MTQKKNYFNKNNKRKFNFFKVPSKVLPATNHVTANKSVINDSSTKASTAEKKEKILGVKIDCKQIILEEKFQCKVNELWDVFSKVELMTAFTRGDVKLDFSKNGE